MKSTNTILILVIALINLLSTSTLEAQTEDETSSLLKKRSFEIGLNFSGDLAYRKLSTSLPSELTDYQISQKNKEEKPIFGFQTGVGLVYNFNSHIGIETGIQYTRRGYKYFTDAIVWDGQSQQNIVNAVVHTSAFHHLSVPLKANFTFGNKKLKFFSSVGASFDYLMFHKETNSYKFPNKDVSGYFYSSKNGLSAFDFVPRLGIGFVYDFSPKYCLRVEPNFRYGLMPQTNTLVVERLWTSGVNCSFLIRL